VKVEILTLFPQFFDSVFAHSILGRACESGALELKIHDIRRFTTDKHQQADDGLYGGGAGMLLLPEPLFRAFESIAGNVSPRPVIIYPSAQGIPFTQTAAAELAIETHLVFLCGHYKGVDQRVVERWVDREYSLGDFVLTGGEVAAAAIIDAIIRLLPGVLGDPESASDDSFQAVSLGAHHYTRPEEIDGMRAPGVLLTGHRENIKHWRELNAWVQTLNRRPDLIGNKTGKNNGIVEESDKKSTKIRPSHP
jgi:tRNA (guanine37-N1)-methyltransferase